MTMSTLIQRIADWLEKKYFNQKTLSARASWPSYEAIASSEMQATAIINTRSGRQNQPSQIAAGMLANRMPFSYTSIACWYLPKAYSPPVTTSTANSQSNQLRREKKPSCSVSVVVVVVAVVIACLPGAGP